MRRNNLQSLLILALLALFMMAALPAGAAADRIRIIDLGTLYADDTSSSANDANERGQVVGWSRDATQISGILWTAKEGMIGIGSLGGNQTSAIGINNRGQVVGVSHNDAGHDRAFLWTMAGGIRDLGTLGGNASSAWGINNSGQVVGRSRNNEGQERAFLWTEQIGMVDLGTLGGGESWAFNAGEAGHIVGWSTTATGETRAFRWTEQDGLVDMGSLGGGSAAYDVNAGGEVVGESCLSGDFNSGRLECTDGTLAHAFLWTATDGMLDLGTLGGDWSWATGINNRGQVIGTSVNAAGQRRAFLWTAADGMIDLGALNDVGGSAALRINERGQITGQSGEPGAVRAVRWTLH